MLLRQFRRIGEDMFRQGLVSAYNGDMSIRLGDRMLITRRTAALAHLTDQDLVETWVDRNDRATPAASSELAVHRAIYRETEAQAIIHAHPRHAVALSLVLEEIVPVDAEGVHFFERVPIVGRALSEVSRDLADEIAAVSRTSRVLIVRGHGCFANGQLLEECHRWVSILEESCRVLWLLRSMGQPRSVGRRRSQWLEHP